MSTELLEVFLSYMSEDAPAVDALQRALESAHGVVVWRDVNRLVAGDDWLVEIEAALRRVDAFVVCLGPVAPAGWCAREIRSALDIETDQQALRIIPVLLGGADPKRIPFWLKPYHALPIPDPTRPEAIDALVRAARGEGVSSGNDLYAQILSAASAHRTSEMAGLNQKYIPALYSPRGAVEREIAAFLESETQAFLVLGEAGAGKTNLVCRLAEEQSSVRPVFFFRARALPSGPRAVEQGISDTIRYYTGLSLGSPLFPALARTLRRGRLLVVVDAINEAEDVDAFAETLATALYDARGTPVQFCLTCRRSDWRFFREQRRIIDSLWISGAPAAQEMHGVTLARFDDAELDDAWSRYRSHPSFLMRGELSPEARKICRHPLMLRFACEAFRGMALPPLLETTDVFHRYWETKVECAGDPSRAAALLALVAELRLRKATSLFETEAIRVVSRPAYDALLSEDIILYVREDPYTRLRFVGFTYEAFLEYCIAQSILIDKQWGQMDAPSVQNAFEKLLVDAEHDRLLVGVAEFLILFLQAHPAFELMLDAMAVSADWKQRLCTLLPRLSRFDTTYLPRLSELARDTEYWVRWAASFAAAQLRSDTDFDMLQALWVNESWPVREAAANASGFREVTSERWERLVLLAGDPYWRVRRAAANALNRHLAQRTLGLDVLDRLLDDPSWRRRDVAIIAQRDLAVAPARSCAMLERLVEDDSVRIRFSVAKFAGTIPSALHFVPLLARLAGDRSAWVRKRVATSAVQFAGADPRGTLAVLGRLALDGDSYVRWEVARGLALFGTESTAVVDALLDQLEGDEIADVRFAAAFSRRRRDGAVPTEFLEALAAMCSDARAVREAIARVTNLLRPPTRDLDAQETALYYAWKSDFYLGLVRGIRLAADQLAKDELASLLPLLLDDAEEGVRWALAQLVGSLGLDASAQRRLVISLLRDPHPWVRQAMAEELTPALLQGNLEIQTELERLALDHDRDLRLSVALTAVRLAPAVGAPAEHILQPLRMDDDVEVRRAAGGVP